MAKCVIALCMLLAVSARPAHADVVLDWNTIAVRTLTTQSPALSPFAQARFAAIVQLAVFEAVNVITGDYEGYRRIRRRADERVDLAAVGSSAEAAAISAAHAVLLNYFPAKCGSAEYPSGDILAAIPNGPAKTNGILAGQAAAAALIALRLGDGSSPTTNYLPSPSAPRDWDITPGCPTTPGGAQLGGILFNWGDVRPFGTRSPRAVTGMSRSGPCHLRFLRATSTEGLQRGEEWDPAWPPPN